MYAIKLNDKNKYFTNKKNDINAKNKYINHKNSNLKKQRNKSNLLENSTISDINYKNVALLRKFISERGKIRSRRVTGITLQEQRKIAKAIKNAREMCLLPYSGFSK